MNQLQMMSIAMKLMTIDSKLKSLQKEIKAAGVKIKRGANTFDKLEAFAEYVIANKDTLGEDVFAVVDVLADVFDFDTDEVKQDTGKLVEKLEEVVTIVKMVKSL